MADQQLLDGVSSFLTLEQAGLQLEEMDTEALLQSLQSLQSLPNIELAGNSPVSRKEDEKRSKQELAKLKAGQRRDAYRRRLKAEWASLRQQDRELTLKLEQLQQAKKPSESEPKSGPQDSVGLAAWRAIALRQYDRRLEAEAVQKRLQSAVNSRAVMIQDLEDVLKKRARDLESLDEDGAQVPEKKARLETRDTVLYKTYFDSLDLLYTKLDDVFREVGTTPTPGGIIRGEPKRKVDGETEYFETIGVGRVPFNYKRTCDAVWELALVPHRQEGRRVYDGLPDPENSSAVQFNAPLRYENSEVFPRKVHHVVRRYVEQNRVVILWRALCEPSGDTPGLTSDETGWCVVHAPPTDSENAAMTLVQACIRIVPMHFQNGSTEKATKDQYMTLMVASEQEDYQEIERMMERLILDDALATDGLAIDELGNLCSNTE